MLCYLSQQYVNRQYKLYNMVNSYFIFTNTKTINMHLVILLFSTMNPECGMQQTFLSVLLLGISIFAFQLFRYQRVYKLSQTNRIRRTNSLLMYDVDSFYLGLHCVYNLLRSQYTFLFFFFLNRKHLKYIVSTQYLQVKRITIESFV